MRVEVAHRTRPCEGFVDNGDAIVVRSEGSTHLLAVIDALGHGPKAAVAAQAACAYLGDASLDLGLRRIVDGLHRHLRGSRGAAAFLCLFYGPRVQTCGVGNVELRTLGCKIPSFLSPGVLGGRVRKFHHFDEPLERGGRLLLLSDGITRTIPSAELRKGRRRDVCDLLIDEYSRPHDDATVLVADVEFP